MRTQRRCVRDVEWCEITRVQIVVDGGDEGEMRSALGALEVRQNCMLTRHRRSIVVVGALIWLPFCRSQVVVQCLVYLPRCVRANEPLHCCVQSHQASHRRMCFMMSCYRLRTHTEKIVHFIIHSFIVDYHFNAHCRLFQRGYTSFADTQAHIL